LTNSSTSFLPAAVENEIDGSLAMTINLDHLVQQLGLVAPEPREILLHNREHIVLVAAGLARGMWRDEHLLHAHRGEAAGSGSSTMTSTRHP
jgi:hypothetical protein